MKQVVEVDRGYIFDCVCGSHMIRLVKDTWANDRPKMHSFEIWEYRAETNWTFINRIKLAFRILIGKEAKYPVSDILVAEKNVEALAKAILSLND
jgi:hypothetical protein